MPRARQDSVTWLTGHYYHIYNRGARQKTIFPDAETYVFVLRRIKEYSQSLAISVIAYCLLPNHYHFLVRQDGDIPAGHLIQRVFNSYSKAYNKQFQTSGTLFERRFQANHVLRDEYLRHLCFYIHSNPVKHGIVEEVAKWPYGNYLEWVGARRGTLVDPKFVKDFFGGGEQYRIALQAYVQAQSFEKEDLPV